MAQDQSKFFFFFLFSLRNCCFAILFISAVFSLITHLQLSDCSRKCCDDVVLPSNLQINNNKEVVDLLQYSSSWNSLDFHAARRPPPKLLKIALFVKKWPEKHHAGGMERHASTLYLALAKRGHDIHIFTASSSSSVSDRYPMKNVHFYIAKTMAAVWNQFLTQNSTGGKPFDVVHTESVALKHTLSRNLTNVAASWHGIAYESIQSDIVQELVRSPDEPKSAALTERLSKVVEEVKFFPSYAHHVATCDNVGNILKRIYMIPEERVHIILNGVDEEIFKPNVSKTREENKTTTRPLVLGMAGRLVKDKGHPLMFEALKQIFKENSSFRDNVVVLVAGDGPWGDRYRELGSSVKVLGALDRAELGRFYNAIDVFVHPTLRAQGFDQTLLEAVLTGKPLVVTKVASIRETGVVDEEMGYTFMPTVESLKRVLYRVFEDGRTVLEEKGKLARDKSLKLFSATKMVAAYEALFLCIADKAYCIYKP